MKQNSLTLGFLLLLGVIALNLIIFSVNFSSQMSKFLFLAMLLFGAFAFAFARVDSNTSSLFLQFAFYSNLFLITIEMLSGARSLLIALSCITSITGMLYAISRLSARNEKIPQFPQTSRQSRQIDSFEEKPLESKREKVEKQLGDYEAKNAKVEPYSNDEKDEITTILKEIESKAKELNLEIKSATSITANSVTNSPKDDTLIEEKKRAVTNPKTQKKKTQLPYSGKVYAGKNSTFYHSADCPVVKRLLKRKEFETIERAEFAGLKPHDCVKGKK